MIYSHSEIFKKDKESITERNRIDAMVARVIGTNSCNNICAQINDFNDSVVNKYFELKHGTMVLRKL